MLRPAIILDGGVPTSAFLAESKDKARVTSKLQVTIPKAIAQRNGIEPGQEIDWLPAGEAIRVVPRSDHLRTPDRKRRLDLFDRATGRQRPTGDGAARTSTIVASLIDRTSSSIGWTGAPRTSRDWPRSSCELGIAAGSEDFPSTLVCDGTVQAVNPFVND